MSYEITRHSEYLIWVKVHGRMSLDHAEHYYKEMWGMLDNSLAPTDLLVDGRQIHSADQQARRRTEQIMHHPHLGRIAFVVAEQHLLMFAPLVHLVSGMGMFGDEHAALHYLDETRGKGARIDPRIVNAVQPPDHGSPPISADPASRAMHSLTDLMNSWSRNLRDWGK